MTGFKRGMNKPFLLLAPSPALLKVADCLLWQGFEPCREQPAVSDLAASGGIGCRSLVV
ncbi:hypothetical protein [Candidatus Methylacidiphilum infernorum]|uniref:hypothetical protein n=1 Tax=Candidatus Methylacidiphilum infernorum TaxID=511746 RepID=UPI0002E55FE5|nr:hypothetical protein [Candidatus Methylacidiphilum infernorum]